MVSENGDPKEPHRLDEMNDRLYRRDLAGRKNQRFDILHPIRSKAKTDWAPMVAKQTKRLEQVASHPSFFKKFFFFALGFAGLAIIIALITFFSGGNTVSNNNIEIRVLGNSFTAGGEELSLQVEIVNKNSTSLELADLFIEYEKGGDASSGAGKVREIQSLGTVNAGAPTTKNLFVTLYGEEGSVKNIDFTLQYRIRGSNAIFVKKEIFPVTISSAPIVLTVDAPENVSPNQKLSFTVKMKSNARDTVRGMLLSIEYPSGFRFDTATPQATSLNNVWNVGDLAPGAEREITVAGTIFGSDGEDRAFRIYAGAASAKDASKIGVVYNSKLQVVSLVRPFIAAHLAINGSMAETVPVASGNTVRGTINWQNNLPTRITDAEITVALSGNALNSSSVRASDGFYDSARQVIVWNKTTSRDLGSIQPSDQGTLDFSFDIAPLWGSGQNTTVRPSVKLSVSIKGKQPEEGGAVSEVSNFEERVAVVSSDLGFSAQAFYNNGPFTNIGPIPPQAGQPTTYTITWGITNSANALSDALVLSTIPTYVEWVGTTSPSSESIEYDATTRSIRWKAGQVPSGAGLSGGPKTVSFQVRLNPSASQKGSTPKLILDTSVSARDTFTGESLSTSKPALSTRLDNDSGFPPGGEVVQ